MGIPGGINPLLLRRAATDAGEAAAYQIEQSIRFNSGDSPQILRIPSGSGDRRRYTYSFWFKACTNKANHQYLFTTDYGSPSFVRILSTGDSRPCKFQVVDDQMGWGRIVDRVIKDPAAWWNLVVAVDSTLSSTSVSNGRVKIYLNGELQTNFTGTSNVPSQNAQGIFNCGGQTIYIGTENGSSNFFDGYIADLQIIDGVQLGPGAFGKFTVPGAWDPIEFALPAPNKNITWSSSSDDNGLRSGGTWAQLFDGSTSTFVTIDKSTNYAVALDSKTITCNASVGVYTITGNSVPTMKVTNTDDSVHIFDGVNNGDWTDYAHSGTIKKIELAYIGGSGSANNFYGLRVDGVTLIDGKTDPSGSGKNNPNDGTQWSKATVSGAGSPISDLDHAFDDDYSTLISDSGGVDAEYVITLPKSIPNVSLVEVMPGSGQPNGAKFKCDIGGTTHTYTVTGGSHPTWVQVYSGSAGTLTAIRGQRTSSNTGGAIMGVKVNGYVLVDNRVSTSCHLKFNDATATKNLGYSQVMNTATGGLPIYGPGASDSNKSNLVLALPGFDLADHHHTIKGSGSAKTVTNAGVLVATDKFKHYGSSLKFVASESDDLAITGDADMAMGTGDFCMEFWVYNTSNHNYNAWISTRSSSASEDGFVIASNSGGSWYVHSNAAVAGAYSGNEVVPLNHWTHIAYTRDSGTHRLFVNGVSTQESTTSRDYTNDDLYISTNHFGGEHVTAWIQDLRVYKSVAKYTSNFIPPVRNDFRLSNITEADSSNPENIDVLVDTPTNYLPTGGEDDLGGVSRGNYCTFNTLTGASITYSNGNLQASLPSSGGNGRGTMGMSSGKFYFEVTKLSGGEPGIGVHIKDKGTSGGDYIYHGNGYMYPGPKGPYGTIAVGTTIGVGVDVGNSLAHFYRDGSYKDSHSLSSNDNVFVYLTSTGGGANVVAANFGQRPFKYQNAGTNRPADDYKALCTQNIEDTFGANENEDEDKNDPSKYFDIATYIGTATSRDITGLGFQPDLVWIKSRDVTYDHASFDKIRGVNKRLRVNKSDQEGTDTQTLTAFNSDGYKTGTDEVTNKYGDNYVAWMWDAGTSAGSNNDGSINVSSGQMVNTTCGFSITHYTGDGATDATVGHGLGVTPAMVWIKKVNGSGEWKVWMKGMDAAGGKMLTLSQDYAEGTSSWQAPTSTLIKPATSGDQYLNASGSTYVAYCWAEVDGFFKTGEYVAEGSTDGPWHWCGFRPQFLMVKMSTAVGNWNIFDTERQRYNQQGPYLRANGNWAEGNAQSGTYGIAVDLLSNGWKNRSGSATNDINDTGQTFQWCAFAENPFKTARAM